MTFTVSWKRVCGSSQSHSLVFRNPPDRPTHRCGVALDISSPSLPGCVTVHSASNCCPLFSVAPSFFRPCVVLLSYTRLCLQIQLICPCAVCVTGQQWSPLVITVSLLGTSPSWLMSLAHSLTSLHMLQFWRLSLTSSRGSSLAVLRFTLIVAPGPAHTQGDACYHALVARNGSWRDFRRSGSHEDQARFRPLRQQFHSTVRSSRTHFWNEWLCSVTSVSLRAPKLACSLIRHTFPSPVATPDLCHAQWHGASRSALPPDEARSWWRAHFSSPTGDSLFSDDFFHSHSLRFASLTSLHESGRFDAPFSYNELVAALSK